MTSLIDQQLLDLIKAVVADVVPFVERNAQRDAEIAALREAWLGLATLLHTQGDIDGLRFANAMQECAFSRPGEAVELLKLAADLRLHVQEPAKPQFSVVEGGKE